MNTHAAINQPPHPFLKNKLGRSIGGRVVDSGSGKVFETVNPATGKTLAHLAEGGATDVDRAVRAARAAFQGRWSKWKRKPYERASLLMPIDAFLYQEGVYISLA